MLQYLQQLWVAYEPKIHDRIMFVFYSARSLAHVFSLPSANFYFRKQYCQHYEIYYDVMMTSLPTHLLQSLGIGLSLLPSLVDPKEGRDGIHPLDQARPRPQRDDSIIPCMVQLSLVPMQEGRGGEGKGGVKTGIWMQWDG